MSQQFEIKANFKEDWEQYVINELNSMGYVVTKNEKGTELTIKYYNALKRMVSAKPRTIEISKEFSCPTDLQKNLTAFKSKAKSGEDLTPYLSKRIKDIEYSDPFLNDWGIHHFHLGMKKEDSKFAERTGPLLFAKVTEKTVCFIDVMNHGDWGR
ncbi:MAG: hypothetical protein GY795_32110 [Desulfobacterales bacterium]|nr:hypothetical protein [Desulfobacterales bacterium]